MRISHAARLIYFSIPKTGSESVRAFLDPLADEPVTTFPETTPERPFYSHMRPVEAAAAFAARGWDFAGYLRIATVRNPWARMASLHVMRQRNRARLGQAPPFGDWLAAIEAAGGAPEAAPGKWYAHGVIAMSAFLAGADGGLLVDRTFRLEDGMESLAQDLAGRGIALPGPPPRINRAPRAYDWRAMYDAEARARVARMHAEDIERWNYGFEADGPAPASG